MSNEENNLLKNQLEKPSKQENNEKNLQVEPELSGFKAFLKKQNIEISFKRYAIDAMGAMALGLFASLLIGTIVNTIAGLVGVETTVGSILSQMGSFAARSTGPAMAIAVGYSLKAPPLVLFSYGVGLLQMNCSAGGLAVLLLLYLPRKLVNSFLKPLRSIFL